MPNSSFSLNVSEAYATLQPWGQPRPETTSLCVRLRLQNTIALIIAPKIMITFGEETKDQI